MESIEENVENRRRFLKAVLKKILSQVKEDPRVKRLLTAQEAEYGLNMVIDRVIENTLEMERRLGRRLTFKEFRKCLLKTLDEFSPKPEYIV